MAMRKNHRYGERLDEKVSSRLKLRDLRMLLAVAEQGSMAKAAGLLSMTQSGVSRAIADLEHALGVSLFDRTAKGVEPTRYGRAMLKGGVAIFDELRQSVAEIEHLADPASGGLRVGCTEPMSWGIVPAIIDRIVQKYPRVSFEVMQGAPQKLIFVDVRERKIELALGAIASELPAEEFESEVLFEERRFVVAGQSSHWAGRRRLTVPELVDAQWVIPTRDSPARILLEELFRTSGLPAPRVSLVSFHIPLHIALLSTGRFLSVLPVSMLQFSAKRMALKMLPIELPVHSAPVGITTLKGRTMSPIGRLFVEHARAVTKPIADRR
jgi:DNA-binding transcriptional LysR family regulator